VRGNTATISLTAFRADWLTHLPMRDLCQRYTVSRDQVIRLKHVWELPPRHDRRMRSKPRRMADPTTTEIQQMCCEIQATWSDDVREHRRVTKTQMVTLHRLEVSYEPSHRTAEWDGSFWEHS